MPNTRTCYVVEPPKAPRTRAGKLSRLTRFVEERLALGGGVTRDGLVAAGFPAADVDDLAEDVRRRIAARGLAAGW